MAEDANNFSIRKHMEREIERWVQKHGAYQVAAAFKAVLDLQTTYVAVYTSQSTSAGSASAQWASAAVGCTTFQGQIAVGATAW